MKRKKKIKAKYCKICIYQFYEELFSKKVSNSNEVIAHCLKDISLPKLTKEQNKQCEDELTENGVKDALQNIICNKTPGNDRLTCEFYKAFWSELKTPLLLSYQKGFLSGELSISQKQVVKPIRSQCTLSLRPEKIRKPYGFLRNLYGTKRLSLMKKDR